MRNSTDSENHFKIQHLLTKYIINKPIIETISTKLNICMLFEFLSLV